MRGKEDSTGHRHRCPISAGGVRRGEASAESPPRPHGSAGRGGKIIVTRDYLPSGLSIEFEYVLMIFA